MAPFRPHISRLVLLVEFEVAQIHATLNREANILLGRETGKGGVRIVLDDEFRKVELL